LTTVLDVVVNIVVVVIVIVVVNALSINTHNNIASNSFRCEALKINCRHSKNSDPSTSNRQHAT